MDVDGLADGNRERNTIEATRDPSYFLPEDFIVFRIEDTLFRIHLFQLLKHSQYFRDLFESSPPSFNEENPFIVDDITVKEFRHFLRIILPSITENSVTVWTNKNSASKDEWISVLKISARWHCQTLRSLAIHKLTSNTPPLRVSDADLTPVEMIVLGRKYSISSWVVAGYAKMVMKKDVTDSEMEAIGAQESLKLMRIIQKMPNFHFDTSEVVVKETFGAEIRSISAAESVYGETAMDEGRAPVTTNDFPLHLEEEHAQMQEKRDAEEESFMTVKIITNDTFSRHNTYDLAVFHDGDLPLSDLPTFRVSGLETYSVFKSRVAKHFHYPENQIGFWLLNSRLNKTLRPNMYIPENEPALTLETIRMKFSTRQSGLRLYLEFLPNPSIKFPFKEGTKTIIVFLKHFDVTKQTLFGAGIVKVPIAERVGHLIPIISERMGWPSGVVLKLYEEIKPGLVELLNAKRTFVDSEIQDGDIICYQISISNKEARDLNSQGLHSNPQQYLKSLQIRG